MNAAPTELVTCPQCSRNVRPAAGCLYCGAPLPKFAGSGASRPKAATPPAHPAASGDASIPGAAASVASAPPQPRPSRTAVPRPLEDPTCPTCGGAPGTKSLPLQTWEDQGYNLMGFGNKQKFLVRTLTVAGVCDECIRRVRKGRILASFLAAVPLAVAAAVIGLSNGRGPGVLFGGFLGFTYSGYLMRWGEYTWADAFLYGGDLEQKLERLTPRGESAPDRVMIPGGCLLVLGRLTIAGLAAVVGLVLGALVSA